MAKLRQRFIKPVYMVTGSRNDRQKRKILAALGSIRQDEFFLAKREGLKPKLMIYVHTRDHKGEELVEVDGVIMSVYRTYVNHETGITELYLTRKQGEQDG